MAQAVPCKCMYKYKAGQRHSKSPATSQNHSMFVLTKHNKSELASHILCLQNKAFMLNYYLCTLNTYEEDNCK